MAKKARGERQITGKSVLIAFIAFFGVVGAVNAIMIRAAVSTFSGVETENAYRVGLAFNRELAAVAAQDARHWQVDAELVRQAQGHAELVIRVRDGLNAPVTTLELAARLTHPADARRDHRIELTEVGAGTFKGQIDAEPGQWDLSIDARRGGDALFRSKSRLALR